MKVPIHVLIDYDIKLKLDKEDNKSEAVNQALIVRYNSVKNMTLEQKKKRLALLELDRKHKAEREALEHAK